MEIIRRSVAICLFYLVVFIIDSRAQKAAPKPICEGCRLSIACDAEVIKLPKEFKVVQQVNLFTGSLWNQNPIIVLRHKDNNTQPVITKSGLYEKNGWTFQTPTMRQMQLHYNANRAWMKAIAIQTEAQCGDSANYSCLIQSQFNAALDGDALRWSTNWFQVTGLLAIDAFIYDPKPTIIAKVTNHSYVEFVANHTQKITCTAKGPVDFIFRWRQFWPKLDPGPTIIDWPIENDVKLHRKSLYTLPGGVGSDCGTYEHTQDLVFTIGEGYRGGAQIACEFGKMERVQGDGLQFTMHKSLEVSVMVRDTKGQGRDHDGPAGIAKLLYGMLAWLVLGAILGLIGLCLLCWWCWPKKSVTKEESKEDEVDSLDANASTSV